MDYEPIARLGRGGMGVVDLARDRDGNRVAMKRLTLHGSASDIMRARQRLLREAEVLRRLHHPNIVRLLDVVEDGDEIVLVMPYMNGGNLAERVTQHGPAPLKEVERLAQRLLGALATAHAKGIIHRDIKPANVLFDDKGEPYLADFGVAHTWDQTGGLTVAGMVVGTPGFMAPEQARDEPLTPASDVFSLGATLLYAASGTGPFGSGDPGLLMVRAAEGKVERIPKSVPSALRRRLKIMVNPRPERRPTAAALLTDDQSALRRPPARTRLTGTGPAMAFAAFAGVVILVALTISGTRETADDADGADRIPPSTADGDADDAGAPVEDIDDTPLRPAAEIPGTIAPGEVDTYWLPMEPGSLPGSCVSGEVALTLTLTTPVDVPLRLEVLQSSFDKPDGTPLATEATDDGPSAMVVIHPEDCSDPDFGFRVVITAERESEVPVDYRIARVDS